VHTQLLTDGNIRDHEHKKESKVFPILFNMICLERDFKRFQDKTEHRKNEQQLKQIWLTIR
jgi:hypothetical protein